MLPELTVREMLLYTAELKCAAPERACDGYLRLRMGTPGDDCHMAVTQASEPANALFVHKMAVNLLANRSWCHACSFFASAQQAGHAARLWAASNFIGRGCCACRSPTRMYSAQVRAGGAAGGQAPARGRAAGAAGAAGVRRHGHRRRAQPRHLRRAGAWQLTPAG